jgi:hypothetical protein
MVLFKTQSPPYRSAERSQQDLDGGRALWFFNVYLKAFLPPAALSVDLSLRNHEAFLVALSTYNLSIAQLWVEVNAFFPFCRNGVYLWRESEMSKRVNGFD